MKLDNKIYFDYNATSAAKPEVIEAMLGAMANPTNPSSVHSYGQDARSLVEKSRDSISNLVNAGNADIIFTSSGTESNNLALRGFKAGSYIVSAIEHICTLETANSLGTGKIKVQKNGIIDLGHLKSLLEKAEKPSLVSVMLANNETGAIQPIKEISKIVFEHGGYLHCDASQAIGKINVDMQDLGVDMMTISAHKFGGPQGVAALLVKKGIELNPIIFGGGQESGKRAGTENVAAIVGFAMAADLAQEDIKKFIGVSHLRNMIENQILGFCPSAKIFVETEGRLPNTTCIYMPGMKSETQMINFDLEGIAVSAGSACSSGKVTTSHVLTAMGVGGSIAENVIRISLTPDTTEKEVNRYIEVWKTLYLRANNKDKILKEAA